MSDEKKPSFLDKIKQVVQQSIEEVGLSVPGAQVRPTRAPGPATAPLKPATRNTDHLARTAPTGQLGSAPTGPLNEPAAPAPGGLPPAELSARRLTMIDDYMNQRLKLAEMKDPTFMYKLVSDERAYQTQRLYELKRHIDLLRDADGPEGEALRAQIERAQAIASNLFRVLKYITGKRGHTGGTHFLSDE